MVRHKQLTLGEYLEGAGTKSEREFIERFLDAQRLENLRKSLAPLRDAKVKAAEILSMTDPEATNAVGHGVDFLTQMSILQAAISGSFAAKVRGSEGGRNKAAGDKNLVGLTIPQRRRMALYQCQISKGSTPGQALDMVAAKEGVSSNAIRQSLKAAGVLVSTTERRGRHRNESPRI